MRLNIDAKRQTSRFKPSGGQSSNLQARKLDIFRQGAYIWRAEGTYKEGVSLPCVKRREKVKDTVHFMKLSYAKELDRLKAHLKYVGRKSACVFVNKKPEGIADFYRFAKERKEKIKNARVAYKFYLALPRDWYWLGKTLPNFWKNRAEDLCQILSEVFGIRKEDAIVFFHKPTGEGEKNFHAHVMMKTVKADGKCLDIKKAHLRRFHQVWLEYLANSGYKVFRVRDYIPEITPKTSRAFNLPVYLHKKDFMPEAKELYRKIRREARRLMEMKMRKPTKTWERELREKKETQLQLQPQQKPVPQPKPQLQPQLKLQPQNQPQPKPELQQQPQLKPQSQPQPQSKPQPKQEPQPKPMPRSKPQPQPQQQQKQQQQAQKPRPKNLDEFVLALARNLLEAGRPREAVFIRLYNYLRKKHPEKANTAYVSDLVRKAWLSLMEERRRKRQRDYPEPDSGLSPPGL